MLVVEIDYVGHNKAWFLECIVTYVMTTPQTFVGHVTAMFAKNDQALTIHPHPHPRMSPIRHQAIT